MSDIVQIGDVPWSRRDMIDSLAEFAALYDRRPIKHNAGGMLSPHLFMAWFALRTLSPKVIVESGVWKGQGTWFFEHACPGAQLHCIDPNLDRLEYKSSRAIYLTHDFSTYDWTHVPLNDTVCFFDDHQNAYERIKTAKWFGFQHLLFEDNYIPWFADCYSLKMAFMGSGFVPVSPSWRHPFRKVTDMLRSRLDYQKHYKGVSPNTADAQYLRRNIKAYAEFPPVFKKPYTRWGEPWDDTRYPTLPPLLHRVEHSYQQVFWDEADSYTWLCYVRV